MQRNEFLIKQQMMEIAQKWTMAALFSSLKTERTGNRRIGHVRSQDWMDVFDCIGALL